MITLDLFLMAIIIKRIDPTELMDFFMEDFWGDESSLSQVMDDYESWDFLIANLLWIHLAVCGVSKVTLITDHCPNPPVCLYQPFYVRSAQLHS